MATYPQEIERWHHPKLHVFNFKWKKHPVKTLQVSCLFWRSKLQKSIFPWLHILLVGKAFPVVCLGLQVLGMSLGWDKSENWNNVALQDPQQNHMSRHFCFEFLTPLVLFCFCTPQKKVKFNQYLKYVTQQSPPKKTWICKIKILSTKLSHFPCSGFYGLGLPMRKRSWWTSV